METVKLKYAETIIIITIIIIISSSSSISIVVVIISVIIRHHHHNLQASTYQYNALGLVAKNNRTGGTSRLIVFKLKEPNSLLLKICGFIQESHLHDSKCSF